MASLPGLEKPVVRKRKTPAPDNLTPKEQRELVDWIEEQKSKSDGYEFRWWNGLLVQKKALRFEVDRCLDWHRANGVLRIDWIATVRNWLRIACRHYLRKHKVSTEVD